MLKENLDEIEQNPALKRSKLSDEELEDEFREITNNPLACFEGMTPNQWADKWRKKAQEVSAAGGDLTVPDEMVIAYFFNTCQPQQNKEVTENLLAERGVEGKGEGERGFEPDLHGLTLVFADRDSGLIPNEAPRQQVSTSVRPTNPISMNAPLVWKSAVRKLICATTLKMKTRRKRMMM